MITARRVRQRAQSLDRRYPGPVAPHDGGDAKQLQWWQDSAGSSLLGADGSLDATLESCYDRALRHSTQIRVFADAALS